MYAIPYDQPTEIDPVDSTRAPLSGSWMLFIGVWLACVAAGVAVATVGKQVVIGAVIMGVPTAIGVVASPTFALCCISLVLPLSGSITFQGVLTADRVVGGLAALGILFHCKFLGPGLFIKGTPIIPMLFLSIWATFSAIWAPNHVFAFVSSLTIFQLVIWAIAVWNGAAYRGNFLWPLRCYVIGMALIVMRLYLTGGLARMARMTTSDARLTLQSTTQNEINPNDFATYLAAGFVVAVYLLLRDPLKFSKLVWIGCAFVFPFMMIITGSRSALVGLAAVLFGTVLSIHAFLRSKMMLVGAVVVFFLVAGAGYIVLTGKFAKSTAVQRILDPAQRGKSAQGRIALIERGLQSIMGNPFLGTGYKNYTTASGYTTTIHNDIVLMAAELGLLGAFLFLYFFWMLFRLSLQTRAPAEKWFVRSVALFYLVTGLAHPLFTVKSFWFFAFFSAAIAYRTRQMEIAQQHVMMPMPAPGPTPRNWGPLYTPRPSY